MVSSVPSRCKARSYRSENSDPMLGDVLKVPGLLPLVSAHYGSREGPYYSLEKIAWWRSPRCLGPIDQRVR
ncbi:protein of unknown function [Paraburkholderia kururiensis]